MIFLQKNQVINIEKYVNNTRMKSKYALIMIIKIINVEK